MRPDVARRLDLLAGPAARTPLWRNPIGGVTFASGDRVVKVGPRNLETSMRAEADRIQWAAAYTPVPTVLDAGEDDDVEWLVTRALPGLSAVDPRWLAEPETAVRAVGTALRDLHDALPVSDCPFVWGVDARLDNAAARGVDVPAGLRTPPPVDHLVVCHGDACCPNTLIGADGRWLAHVDLGALGVADRWADIAVAAMSTGWNYGTGWEETLIDAYGVEPDPERLAYYRALWDAT